MRLVKKIKFKRAKELVLFKKLENLFDKLKNESNNNPKNLRHEKDISKLNFFIVLEYINIINEKIDYDKIFPENPMGRNAIIDYNNLLEEQDKLRKYIQDNSSKGPDYFKHLGILNEVTGCYLVVSTKKHIKSIRSVDLHKKETTLAIKFNLNNLPNEFKVLCEIFSKNRINSLEKEHDEFQKFMNLTTEEQDIALDDILYNVQFPPLISFDEPLENDVVYNNEFHSPSTATTIEFAAEHNLDKLTDTEFIKGMLSAALEKENYELCAKIRDRLLELS